MWEKIKAYVVLEGKLQQIDSLEDLGVDGRTILKGIVKTWWDGVDRIDLLHEMKSVLGQVVGPFERGNETSGSIKRGKCD